MGTHPIFESDFDCLTEWIEIVFIPNPEILLLPAATTTTHDGIGHTYRENRLTAR